MKTETPPCSVARDAEGMLPPHRDPRFKLILYLQMSFDQGGLPALLGHLRQDAQDHARQYRNVFFRGRVSFNRPDQKAAWEQTRGRCFYCGMQLLGLNVGFPVKGRDFSSLPSWGAAWVEVDHFISRKLGGSSRRENLRPACRWCNQVKRGHSVATFRKMFARDHGSPFFYGEIAS